jgi:hypothetical protein
MLHSSSVLNDHCTSTTKVAGIVALVIASVMAEAVAFAASPVPIIYSAPPGCPTATEFDALVTERAKGQSRVAGDEGEVAFIVEIAKDSSGMVGRLRRRIDGQPGPARTVRTGNCTKVAEALALTISLSLSDQLVPAASARLPEPRAVTDVDVTSSARAATTGSAWAMGGGVAATGLLPPEPLPAIALFLEYRWPLRQPAFTSDSSIRLTMSGARNDVLKSPTHATFTTWTTDLDLCPFGSSGSRVLALRLCGVGQVGTVEGTGIAINKPRSTRFFWGALGALLRTRLSAGPRFFLELQAGGLAMLRRPAFIFEMPRVSVTTTPLVVWTAALTFGAVVP